jgi:hypothetical protein
MSNKNTLKGPDIVEGTPPKQAVKKLKSRPIPVTDHAGL